MRKKDETLRQTLLENAQTILDTEDPGGVNIRALAKRAGVASGTVYNYFSGKDDILLALTEQYWRGALAELERQVQTDDFPQWLEQAYAFLRERIAQSAGQLMGSLRNVRAAGRQRMGAMQARLQNGLVARMERDPSIPAGLWTDGFTPAQYANFVLLHLMALLEADAPDISFFLQIVKRTLHTIPNKETER